MRSSIVATLGLVAVLAASAVAILGTATLAAELSGATLPDTLQAGDKTLKLNGLGLRKKAVFKVYVVGLYLESPSKDVSAILAADQAKTIRMHFLRDLTKAQLVEGFREGFEANVKDKAAQKAAFDRMFARSRREGRRHGVVGLRAGEGYDVLRREPGARGLRGERIRGRGLVALAGSQAPVGRSEEGAAGLIAP